MRLTWRDAVATLFLGVIGVITYLFYTDTTLAYVGDVRWALALAGVAGLGMCIVGNAPENFRVGGYTGLMSALGIVSLAVIIGGLITEWEWALAVFAGIEALMWLAAILHRTILRPVAHTSGA
jgi:hypothetical protein